MRSTQTRTVGMNRANKRVKKDRAKRNIGFFKQVSHTSAETETVVLFCFVFLPSNIITGYKENKVKKRSTETILQKSKATDKQSTKEEQK